MSALEDRIRDAYAAADAWGPRVPPLLPEPRRPRHRWAVPLVAAAALAVIMVGTMYAVGRPEPERAAQAPPARFLTQDPSTQGLAVYNVLDGRLVHRLAIRAEEVAAAADGRTFFAAVRSRTSANTFHKIVLDRQGKAAVSRLPIPAVTGHIDSMTVTADGSRLAFTVQDPSTSCRLHPVKGCEGIVGDLRVADVRTGAVTQWSTRRKGNIFASSLDAVGRQIAFSWASETGGTSELRVLDLTRPGHDLLNSRVLVDERSRLGNFDADGGLSMRPDGTAVAVSMSQKDGPTRITEFPLTSGAKPRTLYTAPKEVVTSSFGVVLYNRQLTELLVHGAGLPLSRVSLTTRRVVRLGDPRYTDFHIIAAW
ncbi:hypothetical protein ACGFNU_34220 [Spirillospora sp. NPDC048911]|uniref:hypothetical protein n=1 Tax=Spirillospora sp. NPDC048911 TaxID=3364527 RepID=UPI0037178BAC